MSLDRRSFRIGIIAGVFLLSGVLVGLALSAGSGWMSPAVSAPVAVALSGTAAPTGQATPRIMPRRLLSAATYSEKPGDCSASIVYRYPSRAVRPARFVFRA